MRIFFILFMIVAPAFAQPAPTTAPASQRGAFTLTFTERAEISRYPQQSIRWRIRVPATEKDYNLPDFIFDVYVPENYAPDQPFGLLVYISPSDAGTLPAAYRAVFDKQKLIVIGARKSGNTEYPLLRTGLAIDALFNMKRLYNLDPKRLYVTGVSGGGRCASRMGVLYPDLFTGSLPIVGCDYFHPVHSAEPGVPPSAGAFPASYNQPTQKIYDLSRNSMRFVLLTGEKDVNRAQTKANYVHGFTADGFKHVTYMEVPGMGHDTPPPEWFEKAIQTLDGNAAITTQPATTRPAP